MTDDLNFDPLTEAEREASPQDVVRGGEPRVAKPTLPPADAEPPEAAAARLFGRAPDAFWRYVDAAGALVSGVCRWNKPDSGKEIRPLSWSDGEGWQLRACPAPRPLYHLNKLAADPDALIIVTEGEKAAEAAALIFPESIVTTSSGGAQSVSQTNWTPLAGRRVLIWPDADVSGANYMHQVASILAEFGIDVETIDTGTLAAIDPNGSERESSKKGWDAADAINEWSDLTALRSAVLSLVTPYVATVDATPIAEGDELALERRVVELAALSELKYAVERTTAAKQLGIPVSILDKLVKAQRPRADVAQGRAVAFRLVEPWPLPVNGAELLDQLVRIVRSYVILTATQADAVALWAAFSHCHDAFDVSPRLVVKSPQKRSGKTTLFSVLHRIVAKPRGASGITSSALLRLIGLHQPTMLIDEMDALMQGDREMAQALRGLMNSGFNRTFATHTMNVPVRDGGYEPREFSTWCPLALAGIGHLPDTIRDRSIEIEMQRKLPHEKVKRLRRHDGADLDQLARKLARFSADNVGPLHKARPTMPDGLDDRAADAWEPLSAIADLAGGDWPARARAAALALSGDHSSKDDDIDTLLLTDIRNAFDHVAADRLSSEDLINYLVGLEARPWVEWSHGKPMSKFQLSKRLKNHGIVSGTIRAGKGNETPKGYYRKAFDDAFARYLPGAPVSTRHIATSLEEQGESATFELATRTDCGELKRAEIPSNSRRCGEVASSRRQTAGENQVGGNTETLAAPRPKVIRL
jgi:putative DNA primase/helicase